MELILARALEYTLKYWLKSFTRDQFKLQGRTVQLSNLDINGDALHASLGLPPALNVTTAKVGKLEIMLPSVSNVQIEPIVVQIDRLDLVLEENDDMDACKNTSSAQSFPSPGKGSGYGFADKISNGMTVEVRTVNLLLETHGGARQKGGATSVAVMTRTYPEDSGERKELILLQNIASYMLLACGAVYLISVRRLEAQGVPSKQAEAITAAITEVLNDSLENVAHSFVSKAEMQKTDMLHESNLSKFKTEVQSSQGGND